MMVRTQSFLSQNFFSYYLLFGSARCYVLDSNILASVNGPTNGHSNSSIQPLDAALRKRNLEAQSRSSSHYNVAHQNIRVGAIDILDIGANFIRGQVNQTKPSNVKLKRSPRFDSKGMTPHNALQKRDGPVQCGPNSPCVDGSCCN